MVGFVTYSVTEIFAVNYINQVRIELLCSYTQVGLSAMRARIEEKCVERVRHCI